MEAFVVALRSALDGVDMVTGQPVEVLERRAGGGWVVQGTEVDAVILALPAYDAARLLAVVSPGSAALLGAISYASVAMVTLALPEAAVGRALDGSGHLVPKPVQRTLTAASWASTKWTHWRRPGQVVVRASAGRWGDEHAVDLDDGDLVEAVMVDLERHLGIDGGPTATRVTRWPRSFPQYAPGHLDRVADLERRLAVDAPGVVVAGAAYRGLGIPACIRQGREWAEATMQHLPR
jgi:oxygen-dependent protoporphyrinogen oxidase